MSMPSISSQLRGAVDLSVLKNRATAPAAAQPAPGAPAAPGTVIPIATLFFVPTIFSLAHRRIGAATPSMEPMPSHA